MIKIGFNANSKHFGSSQCYEQPSRFEYCVSDLKKNIHKSNLVESSGINLDENELTNPDFQILQTINRMVEQTHTSKHIEKIKNYETNSIVCRQCGKKTQSNICKRTDLIPIPASTDSNDWINDKLTFSEFISVHTNCSKCSSKFELDNIYCFTSMDTYITPHTYQVVMDGVNVIRMLIDDMVSNSEIKYLFGLIRPPGHHCNNDPRGFCIFNNAMIATKYAIQSGLEKVLILDLDFHHGDGTQAFIETESNPNISFVSIHGYGEAIYPGTGLKSILEKNILNIPLNMTLHLESREYITDDFYQNLFDTRVIEFIKTQNPNIIIVSLGFDAHQDDPLEGMNISDLTFTHITSELKSLSIPLFFITEGGYNAKTIRRLIPKMIKILDV